VLTWRNRILTSGGRLVLVVIGLTGCAGSSSGGAGGTGGGVALPVISAPVTSAPAPGSSGRPAAEHRPTGERGQAVAVVRRYYAVFNGLHRSMDANALASLFTSTCPCQAQVAAVRRAAAQDEHYVDHASVNVMRPSVTDHTHAYVLVNLDTSRGGLERDGTRVSTAAPQRGIQRVFRLVHLNGRWLISRIEVG
jgi:hypothetical protein